MKIKEYKLSPQLMLPWHPGRTISTVRAAELLGCSESTVHMLIQEAATGDAQAGAAWALDGGAAVFLLCLTIAQHVTERGAPARAARALAGVALVLLALLVGALTPVSFVACSAAALLALVVYEIRLGLAEQRA